MPLLADDSFDDFDDFDETINLEAIQEYENTHQTRAGSTLNVQATSKILDSLLKRPAQPLWKSTLAPKGRDVLYLLPHKITTLEYGGLAISPFFNMTNNMHVGASSLISFDSIDKELAHTFLSSIKKTPADISFDQIHFNELTDHFKKFNIQDRKAGCFVQGGFTKGPFLLQFQSSIHLAAKNFWLNVDSQKRVRFLLGRIDPALAEGQLSDKEFYILRYGMGDTRIKAGINSLNMPQAQVDTGFEFILPTSRFVSQSSSNIALSENLFTQEVSTLLEITLPQILRLNIRDLLLEPPLGNGGHFGVGWYIESKINFLNEKVHLWLRLSYDNLLSRNQKRLVMYKPSGADPQVPAFGPPNMVDSNHIKFINKLLREYYIPSVFDVELHPGGVFNFVSSLNTSIGGYNFSLGYDYLHQQRGRIKAIYNSGVSLQELAIEGATPPHQSQHKIFGEVMRSKRFKIFKGTDLDLNMGLGGDVTVKSKNLGYDWTVYLKFATSF